MKTRKNLMVLVLLSLFLSVGVADSGVTSNSQTELNQALYSLMEKEGLVEEGDEEDVKKAISEITSDKKITKKELELDLLLESDVIAKIKSDKKILPYIDFSKDVTELSSEEYNRLISEKIRDIEKMEAEIEAHDRSAEANNKEAEAHRKLTDTIDRTLKALGGD